MYAQELRAGNLVPIVVQAGSGGSLVELVIGAVPAPAGVGAGAVPGAGAGAVLPGQALGPPAAAAHAEGVEKAIEERASDRYRIKTRYVRHIHSAHGNSLHLSLSVALPLLVFLLLLSVSLSHSLSRSLSRSRSPSPGSSLGLGLSLSFCFCPGFSLTLSFSRSLSLMSIVIGLRLMFIPSVVIMAIIIFVITSVY